MRQEMWEARAALIREHAAAGKQPNEIARATGLNYQTVRNYLRRFNISCAKAEARLLGFLEEAVRSNLTFKQTADRFGVSQQALGRAARANGIQLRHGNECDLDKDRSNAMAALYLSGYTLQQIGDQYGITRERVRQVIKKRTGITRKDGGLARAAADKRDRNRQKREADCLLKWGCSVAQHRQLLALARQMKAEGHSPYQTPTGAFRSQRNSAKNRNIEWDLTLWQWWTIWQASGHWDDRGRGQGYVMCRNGDDGAYAVGNVFIAPARLNSSDNKNKKSNLPMGVRHIKRGNYETYVAQRMIAGKQLRLGNFKTPELAHAAYLLAAPTPGAAA